MKLFLGLEASCAVRFGERVGEGLGVGNENLVTRGDAPVG